MSKDESVYEKMEQLRETDADYRRLVYEITTQMDNFIASKNAMKSYRPRTSRDYMVKFTVPAVPITGQEKEILRKYLEEEYLGKIYGSFIVVKKCWFRKKYKICSKHYW